MTMVGKQSPWGKINHETPVTDGIVFVGTAGHGGFKLDRIRNAKIPDYMRQPGGWYEEDCEYAMVIVAFPQHFPPADVETAKKSLCDWFPDHYAQFYGVPLESLKGKSRTYDQRVFEQENADKWVVVTAWYSPDKPCPVESFPEGKILVAASLGGKPCHPTERRFYFIPAAEYRDAPHFGFVIDETKYNQFIPQAQSDTER